MFAAIFVVALAAAGPVAGQDVPDSERVLYQGKAGASLPDGPVPNCPGVYRLGGEEGEAGFDMLHYRLDIHVDPGALWLGGTVTSTVRVVAGAMDAYVFHLRERMNITDIRVNGGAVAYVDTSDTVQVNLGAPYALGETLTVEVDYNGHPGGQGLRFYDEATYSHSEPDLARAWFPCYDEPWDKATSEIIVTVPDTLFCASNGLLLSDVDNLDGTRTFHWRTNYRHSTYLMSVAISDYVSFSQWFHHTPTDSMEMPYYVYPSKLADALVSFSNDVPMMEFFSNLFGLYPFIEEKYGTALVPLGGAMENFTCTSFGHYLIFGTHKYDWVIAHELAHSWFGNSVTMGDWRDIWLNEGFATYADALWFEHIDGPAGLAARMDLNRTDYFNEDATQRFPVFDPDNMWSATVYKKGAGVLHMLRYLVGDPAFFLAVRTYYDTYAFQTASTPELQSVFETVSGLALGDFFDQWVYQAGYPEYEYTWYQFYDGGDYQFELNLEQVQTGAPVFTIPLEVLVVMAAGDSLLQLPVGGTSVTYRFAFDSEPLGVQIDPNNWVLHQATSAVTGVTIPRVAARLTAVAYPVPSSGPVSVAFNLSEETDVHLEIFNAAGRRVGAVQRPALPAGYHRIDLGQAGAGLKLKRTGVYFYRLTAGNERASGKFMLVR